MMTDEQMSYFVAGYIYAQAEETVRGEFPSLSDSAKRKETLRIYRAIIRGLIKDLVKGRESELRF